MVDSAPTEDDWRSEPWDLDVSRAYQSFAGKSFEEAVALFQDDAVYYQEDVMFMPAACFPFYLKAYMAYLMSEDSRGDSDGANCFFGLAEVRAREISIDASLTFFVVACLTHLSSRQDFYDADVSIYGSFAQRAQHAMVTIGSERSRP